MPKDKNIHFRASDFDITNLNKIRELTDYSSDSSVIRQAVVLLLSVVEGKPFENTFDLIIKPHIKK